MKQFISIIILSIIVNVLCVWDFINTKNIFEHMETESTEIYNSLLTTEVTDQKLSKKILDLKDYWTDKMDILVISISRKDLQPISDHLQFLDSAISNNDQDSAVTYSLLLKYTIEGLHEVNSISLINVL